MNNDIERKFAIIQSVLIVGLIVAFVLVGEYIFKTNKKMTIDIKNHEGYSLELITLGNPTWPFGAQRGKIVLKNSEDIEICSLDITVLNDGSEIERNNWSVEWEADRVTVKIRGFEDKRDKVYYLFYDGQVKKCL